MNDVQSIKLYIEKGLMHQLKWVRMIDCPFSIDSSEAAEYSGDPAIIEYLRLACPSLD